MVDAAAEFKKAGYSEQDAKQLALISQMYTNVADAELNAGESANFIISQMKAFNMNASQAEHIIDAVNNVSNNMAVSSADLATNIGNVSAALSVGNNSYEQTLALLTGIVEITRNGAKASRSLVSVQSRLNQIVDESSDVGKALSAWYAKHHIEVLDQEGQMRSLYDILQDVGKIWKTLSKNEQLYYLNQQAGANQTQNLSAALSNMEGVQKAYALALNSSGSAMKENEKAVNSLEGKTNSLKAEFMDLANDVIPNELIKSLLEFGKELLELINNPIGLFIIRWGLVSSVVGGAGGVFLSFAKKIVPIVQAALASLTTGALTAQAAFGWISIAIGAVVALTVATKELNEATNKTPTQKLEEYETNLSSLNEELDKNVSRLKEIEGLGWTDRTQEINDEYFALKQKNEELQESIKLQKINASAARTEALKNEAFGAAASTYGYVVDPESTYGKILKLFGASSPVKMGGEYATREEAVAAEAGMYGEKSPAILTSFDKVYTTIEGTNSVLEDYLKKLRTGNQLTSEENANLLNLLGTVRERKQQLEDNNELRKEGIETGYVETEQDKKMVELYNQLSTVYQNADDALVNFGQSLSRIKEVSPDLYSYMEKNGFTVKAFSDYCADAKINALDLAQSLVVAAESWKTYNQAAAAGFANVMTKTEFLRHKNTKDKYGSYENYLSAMQSKYQGQGNDQYKSFIKTLRKQGETTGGGGTQKTTAEQRLETFQKQVKALDHQLAMGEISTENYYEQLQRLMDAYLQDAENQETLWKYQEKVYSYKQKMLEDETKQQEELNKEIEKQIELQEKLRDAAEALAKAQQKRILVFQKGGYGYVQDVDAISAAQAEYAKVKSGYANGTVYSSAGLHMFGENGPELGVIGSGNGVLPTDITKNLWEWGMSSPSEMFQGGFGGLGGDSLSFSGVTMSFPNVKNGNDAQGFMQSLVMLARQRAYKRY